MCGTGLEIFFFKQKTAYDMRISDWSSDVCSSDLLGSEFVLRRGRRELLQLQLQLVEQPCLAFGVRPVERASELLDLELEMGDQRRAAGQVRLRIGRLGLRRQARLALGDDHRVGGGKIGGKRLGGGLHDRDGITSIAVCKDRKSTRLNSSH